MNYSDRRLGDRHAQRVAVENNSFMRGYVGVTAALERPPTPGLGILRLDRDWDRDNGYDGLESVEICGVGDKQGKPVRRRDARDH